MNVVILTISDQIILNFRKGRRISVLSLKTESRVYNRTLGGIPWLLFYLWARNSALQTKAVVFFVHQSLITVIGSHDAVR